MGATFWKYHGLGNDFLVVDRPKSPISTAEAIAWCHRHRGIGADGILVLTDSPRGVRAMSVINADGSTAEMCGNGIRCVAKYLVDHAGAPATLAIDTEAGLLRCETFAGADHRVGEVRVDMGRPELVPAKMPFVADGDRFVRGVLEVNGQSITGTAVGMGNPHFVIFDGRGSRIADLGPAIETHPRFPRRTNVELATTTETGLTIDVWERGVGITEACGTGACATAVAAVLEGRSSPGHEVEVRLTGGTLHVEVAPDLAHVFMRGPAVEVFHGEI
jgi:diaminopimelate epimerase